MQCIGRWIAHKVGYFENLKVLFLLVSRRGFREIVDEMGQDCTKTEYGLDLKLTSHYACFRRVFISTIKLILITRNTSF